MLQVWVLQAQSFKIAKETLLSNVSAQLVTMVYPGQVFNYKYRALPVFLNAKRFYMYLETELVARQFSVKKTDVRVKNSQATKLNTCMYCEKV